MPDLATKRQARILAEAEAELRKISELAVEESYGSAREVAYPLGRVAEAAELAADAVHSAMVCLSAYLQDTAVRETLYGKGKAPTSDPRDTMQ